MINKRLNLPAFRCAICKRYYYIDFMAEKINGVPLFLKEKYICKTCSRIKNQLINERKNDGKSIRG